MNITQYHVYKGYVSDSPLSTFTTLYIGFNKEEAEKIYRNNRTDDKVCFDTETITFNFINFK
jgi:hypothetical protein